MFTFMEFTKHILIIVISFIYMENSVKKLHTSSVIMESYTFLKSTNSCCTVLDWTEINIPEGTEQLNNHCNRNTKLCMYYVLTLFKTTIRSASWTYWSWCVTKMRVLLARNLEMHSTNKCFPTCESTAESGSSRRYTSVLRYTALQGKNHPLYTGKTTH